MDILVAIMDLLMVGIPDPVPVSRKCTGSAKGMWGQGKKARATTDSKCRVETIMTTYNSYHSVTKSDQRHNSHMQGQLMLVWTQCGQ